MKTASRTHVGLVRDNNEDAVLLREPYLFAVADGLGGYAAGEIASRSTLKALEAATYALRHNKSSEVLKVMEEAFVRANEHVYKMAGKNESYRGMGTTMTAVYLSEDGSACCCHVGDSRLYLYRGGVLRQMTRDHTYVWALLEQGKITAAEAAVHPQRHLLLKALGVEEQVEIDSLVFRWQENDRLLLCSDGLTDMLTDEDLADHLALADVEQAAEALLEHCLDNGGRDNVSLIVIELDGKGVEGSDGCK